MWILICLQAEFWIMNERENPNKCYPPDNMYGYEFEDLYSIRTVDWAQIHKTRVPTHKGDQRSKQLTYYATTVQTCLRGSTYFPCPSCLREEASFCYPLACQPKTEQPWFSHVMVNPEQTGTFLQPFYDTTCLHDSTWNSCDKDHTDVWTWCEQEWMAESNLILSQGPIDHNRRPLPPATKRTINKF